MDFRLLLERQPRPPPITREGLYKYTPSSSRISGAGIQLAAVGQN